jgi:ribosome-associated protein
MIYLTVEQTNNLTNEMVFTAVRSSGPGGQSVNKTSSKVVVSLDIRNSKVFTHIERELLESRLKLTGAGILIVSAESERSQHQNKSIAIERMLRKVHIALNPPKKRVDTRVPKREKRKRLDSKKRQSISKQNRKKPEIEE